MYFLCKLYLVVLHNFVEQYMFFCSSINFQAFLRVKKSPERSLTAATEAQCCESAGIHFLLHSMKMLILSAYKRKQIMWTTIIHTGLVWLAIATFNRHLDYFLLRCNSFHTNTLLVSNCGRWLFYLDSARWD